MYFNPEEELEKISKFLDSILVISFNKKACEEFGRVYAFLNKKGKQTREADLMIASIAKVNNLILITRDKKHFDNTGVNVEVW